VELVKKGDKMKKIILITILAISFLGALIIPSMAFSSLANDFLKACTALDSEFPPTGWDQADLRDAAIEVLNSIERGDYPKWPIDFCLKAIGSTQYPEDLDRILAYEKTMNDTVLKSLSGFPSSKSVEFLIKYLGNKEATKRELAAWSLSEIDFTKFDRPTTVRNKVLLAIKNARGKEKESWLKKDFAKVIEKIESDNQTT
jgi:hypothetical protein